MSKKALSVSSKPIQLNPSNTNFSDSKLLLDKLSLSNHILSQLRVIKKQNHSGSHLNKLLDDISSKENLRSPDNNKNNSKLDNLINQAKLKDPFEESLSEISNSYFDKRQQKGHTPKKDIKDHKEKEKD